jgi:hypothetical protein
MVEREANDRRFVGSGDYHVELYRVQVIDAACPGDDAVRLRDRETEVTKRAVGGDPTALRVDDASPVTVQVEPLHGVSAAVAASEKHGRENRAGPVWDRSTHGDLPLDRRVPP